jgi:hypothetical protein
LSRRHLQFELVGQLNATLFFGLATSVRHKDIWSVWWSVFAC